MQQYREASPERAQLLRILTHVLFGLEATDEELVFKCSEKIYEEDPALVLRCFVDEQDCIGRQNIYHTTQHLRRLTQREATALRRNALPIRYLRVVTPHLATPPAPALLAEDHNLPHLLALLYIETLTELQNSPPSSASPQDDAPAVIQQYTAELRALLRQNPAYLPEKLLDALPAGKMLEERCIVLSRLHEHEQALAILLYSLRNLEKGYEYCAEVCQREDPRDQRVYQSLVHV